MKEHAGQAVGADVAEIIKERLGTIHEFQNSLDSVDLEDMNDWILMATKSEGKFLMNHHMLPAVAYGLANMIMTVRSLASKSEWPQMEEAVQVAVQQAYEDYVDQT